MKRTYGSTEAPSIVTDGEPIGAVELRVDAGGELQVRGPEVCLGYVDAEQTAAAFTVDGWYRTGDLASLDPVEILGRRDDVINRGGEKINAAEVEAALEAHPAIRHAVVLPYPDRTMGERIAAVVVADGAFDVEAARAWFAERGSRATRRRNTSSSSMRSRCWRRASPTAPNYAVRSSQGEVSTPIILKPLMTAFGFSVPGFQW